MEREMAAIVFPRAGEVEIRNFTLPPCGPEEIVVQTRYSLVSTGTELRVWAGHYGAADKFPLIPGYSIVGEVVEAGESVTGFAVGDLVSGRNPLPLPGITQYWGAQASHHRYLATGYDCLLKLPGAVTDPLVCVLGEVAGIPWRGVKHAEVEAGETALVVGQGLIGALSGALLVLQGARTVVADVWPGRLERSSRWGVTPVNARETDANARIRELLPEGADVVVEASGQPGPATNALQFLRSRGTGGPGRLPRLVLQANYLDPIPVDLARLAPTQSLAIYYPGDREPEDRAEALQFCAEGKLRTEDFVGEVLDVSDAPAAYPALRDDPDAHFSVAFRW